MQNYLMSWARWLRRSPKASRRPGDGRTRYRCRVEPLEARWLPSAQLVVDLNPITQHANPELVKAVGETVFFMAADGVHGFELWRTDGTEKGTRLVKDIVPGPGSPFNFTQRLMTVGDGRVFFTADDGVHGEELWTSDGTEKGTFLVKDIRPGPLGAFSSAVEFRPTLTYWDGALYVGADDGVHGMELWRSDGTEKGTYLVHDANPGAVGSVPYHMTAGGGTLFYIAWLPDIGYELWRSDGTAKGTGLVKDIHPGPRSAFDLILTFPQMTLVNGTLFFAADDGVTGRELWKSDGTAKGTALVKDIFPGDVTPSPPQALTNFGGTLLFTAIEPATGREVWRSDGTEAGTVRVTDLVPGRDSPFIGALTPFGGLAFFSATVPESGRELWRTDGTAAGTTLVKDIFPGAAGSTPSGLTNFNGRLFFSANEPETGNELWASDGTAQGTVLVQDIFPGPTSAAPSLQAVAGVGLFFTVNDPIAGRELWVSDGTAQGARLITDVNRMPSSSNPDNLVAFNGMLFFTAQTEATGIELWKTDGTAAGTTLVKDIYAGRVSSTPRHLTVVGEALFFTAFQPATGTELWKTNGTEEGTVLVKDIGQGMAGSEPTWLTNINGTLFFSADSRTPSTGPELWKSDGTAEGTILVRDINPGPVGSNPNWMHIVNGRLIFMAFHRDYGAELWTSDGTRDGTVLLKDIWPGTAGFGTLFFPLTSVLWDGILYFPANDGEHGYELWRTDGTEKGTVLVKDIAPGSAGSGPYNLTLAGGTLYFTANDGSTGRELWKSDGTEKGTTLVKDIFPGKGGAFSERYFTRLLAELNGRLYFVPDDGVHGHELWQSDGTEAGTELLVDLLPGEASPFQLTCCLERPAVMTVAYGFLFFLADDGKTGRELWRTDGTEKGTVLDTDIYPGKRSSEPREFMAWEGRHYFTADDGAHGRELWAVTPGSSPGGGGAPDGFADLPLGMHLVDEIGQGDIAGILSRKPAPAPLYPAGLFARQAKDLHG